MSNIDSVISSFRESLKLKKVIGLIYVVQLILAIIVAIVAGSFINTLAHTASIHELLSDFNYQIIEDLKVAAQSNWAMISKVAFIVALLYVVISLFLHSGLLYCIYHRRYTLKDFGIGVKSYYRRFLFVAIFFLVLSVAWTILIWFPYLSNLFHMMEHWVAEYMIVWLIPMLSIIYFIGLAFLFAWSVQTRYFMIYQSHWSFSVFKQGFRQVTAQLKQHYIQMFLFAALLMLIYGVSMMLDLSLGVSSAFLVLLFFIIQQCVVLVKLWHKVSVYISLRNLQRIRRDG